MNKDQLDLLLKSNPSLKISGSFGKVDIQTTKKPKYNNTKTDGYDSKKEAKRAYELQLLEKAGVIADLKEQVVFEIQEKFECDGPYLPITYKADFTYYKDGLYHIEDVKGVKTDVYRIKKKLLLYKLKQEGLNFKFLET